MQTHLGSSLTNLTKLQLEMLSTKGSLSYHLQSFLFSWSNSTQGMPFIKFIRNYREPSTPISLLIQILFLTLLHPITNLLSLAFCYLPKKKGQSHPLPTKIISAYSPNSKILLKEPKSFQSYVPIKKKSITQSSLL
jgi:hypothetical protein